MLLRMHVYEYVSALKGGLLGESTTARSHCPRSCVPTVFEGSMNGRIEAFNENVYCV